MGLGVLGQGVQAQRQESRSDELYAWNSSYDVKVITKNKA